ncbi:Hypothetical protein NTJ_06115 [Nesidiocoris tenuis]|uniref:Peptidase S1 domain-containing protein n=1 Tax=Nesidiocoris tenuis TaxID=355587 RepID=A0ABN7AM35_9HEMI|nr:Hypothetical protein NTJ_06115 [Nesidiocoris tenuis]
MYKFEVLQLMIFSIFISLPGISVGVEFYDLPPYFVRVNNYINLQLVKSCGGAILNSETVITTGSCIFTESKTRVKHDPLDNATVITLNLQVAKIKSTLIHPSYEGIEEPYTASGEHMPGAALIIVKDKLELLHGVGPVKMYSSNITDTLGMYFGLIRKKINCLVFGTFRDHRSQKYKAIILKASMVVGHTCSKTCFASPDGICREGWPPRHAFCGVRPLDCGPAYGGLLVCNDYLFGLVDQVPCHYVPTEYTTILTMIELIRKYDTKAVFGNAKTTSAARRTRKIQSLQAYLIIVSSLIARKL